MKPCIQSFGRQLHHTWDFVSETWLVETEIPIPPEFNGQILSCVPSGFRFNPVTKTFHRFKQEWHFGGVYECVWCHQRKYEDKWFSADSYERHLAETRRLA